MFTRTLLVSTSAIFALSSCKRSYNEIASRGGASDLAPIDGPTTVPGDDALPQNPEPFVQPKLPTNLKHMTAPVNDVNTVPEGLTVTGDGRIDPKRNTIIYIHGWSRDGTAEKMLATDKWQDPTNVPPGFNTLVFRWHRDSFSQEVAPFGPEQKVWSGVGDKAVNEYKRLARSLGAGYENEIWVVGHSLGSQVATYMSYVLQRERFPLMPARIELLDPQFMPGSRVPAGSRFASESVPNSTGVDGKEIAAIFHGMMFTLNTIPKRVPIVAYASMRTLVGMAMGQDKVWSAETAPTIGAQEEARIKLAYKVFDGIHYQAMGKGWLSNLIPESGEGLRGFIQRITGMLTEQHLRIREYYFESVDSSTHMPPIRNAKGGLKVAFHARTDTQFLSNLAASQRLVQVEGQETVSIDDDVYESVQQPRCEQRAGVVNFFCINF